jgi:hypothetical protein
VTINNDWFVWAFPGQIVALPFTGTLVGECPQAQSNVEYTLKRVPGNYSPTGLCMAWESDERAVNLAAEACDPNDPIFAVCGPWQPQSRVDLTAQRLGDDSTVFTLSFSWAVCRGTDPANALISGFSCVRLFEAVFHEDFTNDPFGDGNVPYALSTTETGWGVVEVFPAT